MSFSKEHRTTRSSSRNRPLRYWHYRRCNAACHVPYYNLNLTTVSNQPEEIIEIWDANLEDAFVKIKELVERCPFVAFDTEFPGIVTVMQTGMKVEDIPYRTYKENVEMSKLIQLGLAFFDCFGNCPVVLQFNFDFDLMIENHNVDSIKMLKASGIDFDKLRQQGIPVARFMQLLKKTRLIGSHKITWLSFHGSYDFLYLLRGLGGHLPNTEIGFFSSLNKYIPHVFDIKLCLNKILGLPYGLEAIRLQLLLSRIGTAHQAGSDSHLTGITFFETVKHLSLHYLLPFKNMIYGLQQTTIQCLCQCQTTLPRYPH